MTTTKSQNGIKISAPMQDAILKLANDQAIFGLKYVMWDCVTAGLATEPFDEVFEITEEGIAVAKERETELKAQTRKTQCKLKGASRCCN